MRLIRVELENIAIAASLSVGFEAGFTVVTGETGAGKSLLGDAMSLAFGERVSPADILRHGQTRGRVSLTFSFAEDAPDRQSSVRQRLSQAGVELFEEEREITITREFSAAASRIRLNGAPVTREAALALRPSLLDLHGQHDLTTLFDPDSQRQSLDALGDPTFQALKRQTAQAVADWRERQAALDQALARQVDAQSRREAAQDDLALLVSAQLEAPDEDARLRQSVQRLGQGEKLMQLCARALAALSGEDERQPDALSRLADAARHLAAASALDPALQTAYETAVSALETLKDVSAELSQYFETLELSPEALQTQVERLDALEKIKRRFGPTLDEAIATRERLSEMLFALQDVENGLETLARQAQTAHDHALVLSEALSAQRRGLATQLQEALQCEMEALALRGARFEVDFAETALGTNGSDVITFLFSANPGEPLRPLAKVASGGELSRFLLALKAITATSRGVCALVFDEIDAGVSGRTARAVAERLQALARRMQVIAITHQPVVAALGERHLHVEKTWIEDPSQGGLRADVRIDDVSHDPSRRRAALAQLASGLDSDDDDEVVRRYIDRLMGTASPPDFAKTEDLAV